MPHLIEPSELWASLAPRGAAAAAGRRPRRGGGGDPGGGGASGGGGGARAAAAAAALGVRQWFTERVTSNLRLVFSFSPHGDGLRAALRVCPALASHTTIDLYDPWPPEALAAVAAASLADVSGVVGAPIEGVVAACVTAHAAAGRVAASYAASRGRRVDVTPPLFLAYLRLLEALFEERRSAIFDERGRFDSGLSKLLSTAEAVADMQQELEELKPRLIVKSVQADEMMATVSADRRAADETRRAVAAEEAHCAAVAAEAKGLEAQCEAELAAAIPALEAALQAVRALSKGDVAEVKGSRTRRRACG